MDWTSVRATPGQQWQKIRFPYTAPAGTDGLEILVYAIRQHAKARLWVDDFKVVRVPGEPLELEAAGARGTSLAGPPEE